MARFCVCGCGKELIDDDGFTDYHRWFFSPACRNKDKAQRMRDQRARARNKKNCPRCGRPWPEKKNG